MWAISVFEALLLTATKSAEVEGSKLESNKWEELKIYLWVMPFFFAFLQIYLMTGLIEESRILISVEICSFG